MRDLSESNRAVKGQELKSDKEYSDSLIALHLRSVKMAADDTKTFKMWLLNNPDTNKQGYMATRRSDTQE